MSSINEQSADVLKLYSSQKMSKIEIIQKCKHPGQFILSSKNESSSDDYSDEEMKVDNLSPYANRLIVHQPRNDDPICDTPDIDFMMPRQVREVLQSEGLTRPMIDRTIGTAEKHHRKAKYLQLQQQM